MISLLQSRFLSLLVDFMLRISSTGTSNHKVKSFLIKFFKKVTVENFAESIKFEFIDTLVNQKWMDVETKSRAKDKANRMKDKYGFPPYLLNNTKIVSEYDGLVLKETDDFWGYTWAINEWAIENHNKKLRKPVDKVNFPHFLQFLTIVSGIVVNVSTGNKCLLQPDRKCDGLSSRNSSATALSYRLPELFQLRCNRLVYII